MSITILQVDKADPMRALIPKLFRWQPSRETLAALVAGIVVVALSAAMLPFYPHWPWVSIAIRDIGQILLVGVLFPLMYISEVVSPILHPEVRTFYLVGAFLVIIVWLCRKTQAH